MPRPTPAPQARWHAPGRVNLIGEHTDYNDGFALPLAIEAGCVATVTRADGRDLTIRSAQREGPVVLGVDELTPGTGGWAGYAAGVLWALRRREHAVPGLAIDLDGSVPLGAGLSSSAALTCSVACAVNDLLGLGLDNGALLAVTRSAENDFVGAPTGGLDQLAALNCTAGHALFCDLRSLEISQVPMPLDAEGLALLVVDTRARHSHTDGEYGSRRAGCERAATQLGVPALRDVTEADLAAALATLADGGLRRLVRHVVTENARVLRTVELLRAGRLGEIGPLLDESHRSLREDFRVSCVELDVTADALRAHGALGARLTGGGFGGSVIALVPRTHVPAALAAVAAQFARHEWAPPRSFEVRPQAGAHRR